MPPTNQGGGARMLHFDLPEAALQNANTLRALEAIGPTLPEGMRTQFDTQIRNQLHRDAAATAGTGRGGGDGGSSPR